MINVVKSPTYETLKSNFFNGIEFKRVSPEKYLAKHPISTTVNNENLATVLNGLYRGRKNTKTVLLDWDGVLAQVATRSHMSEVLYKGMHLIKDTFNQGGKNPGICFMAWYDALAEYVLSAANSLIGQKAPIPVIRDELTMLSKSLATNTEFKDAKRNVYKELKRIYPKTYKKRLKIMEQQYDRKIKNGIDEIVKIIVR